MRRSDRDMLHLAVGVALRKDDVRAFRLGAVGLRNDGALVTAANGPAPYPHPDAHAEARLCAKLTPGSTVWVARVRRDGTLGIARPCARCLVRVTAAGVERIVYTLADDEWGVIDVRTSAEVVREGPVAMRQGPRGRPISRR